MQIQQHVSRKMFYSNSDFKGKTCYSGIHAKKIIKLKPCNNSTFGAVSCTLAAFCLHNHFNWYNHWHGRCFFFESVGTAQLRKYSVVVMLMPIFLWEDAILNLFRRTSLSVSYLFGWWVLVVWVMLLLHFSTLRKTFIHHYSPNKQKRK